jgi:hypothetical protein
LPNGPIFTKFPVLFPVSRESRFRDRFAADCLIRESHLQGIISGVRICDIPAG